MLDPTNSGQVRRTEFIEILGKLGLYLLEEGKMLEQAKTMGGEQDLRARQMQIISRLRGSAGGGGGGGLYLQNAPRIARKMLLQAGNDSLNPNAAGDFKVSE